jgi:hypothetical protein
MPVAFVERIQFCHASSRLLPLVPLLTVAWWRYVALQGDVGEGDWWVSCSPSKSIETLFRSAHSSSFLLSMAVTLSAITEGLS